MICILSLVYRKEKWSQSTLPDKSRTLRPWSKSMIIISDYALVLKEDIGVFWLRAVRTPIYVLYVKECFVIGILVLASAKNEWRNEGMSDDPQVPMSELP